MISPRRAAALLAEDYLGPITSAEVFSTLNSEGVCAVVVDVDGVRVGLIRGTDRRSDWLRYNFRFLAGRHIPTVRSPPKVRRGESRRWWHAGFLKHAEVAYGFFKDKGVRQVVGHSLGAAAAQIVGISLEVPTIALAAPKVLYEKEQPAEWARLVTCYNRIDDRICHQPREWTRVFTHGRVAHHVGRVVWLDLPKHKGSDHGVAVSYEPHLPEIYEVLDEAASST